MRRFAVLSVPAILLVLLGVRADDERLQGFSLQSSSVERQWEEKFRGLPTRITSANTCAA